jgi:preprotein translocase SecE subunit
VFDWDSLKGSTYVVLVLTFILTLFLFFVDFVLSKIISYLI